MVDALDGVWLRDMAYDQGVWVASEMQGQFWFGI
jgi:hypothetical protein